MKILLKESDNQRIVQKRLWAAFFLICICRQKRVWYGWKTISWLYSGQCKTISDYQSWFDWDVNKRKPAMGSFKQF